MTTTKNTPANVAAIAGQGKRTGKGTNPAERTSPVVHVAAPVREDDVALPTAVEVEAIALSADDALELVTAPPAVAVEGVTVEGFRAAIDAADAAGTYSSAAAATLAAATLARYYAHAVRFMHAVDGRLVVLSNDRAAVALKVWNDAGFGKAPAAAERTPALKSLGQYVAKFGTVATDLAYGVEHLSSTVDANAAYDEISADSTAAKRAAADAAFERWALTLLPADRAAIDTVRAMFNTDSGDADTHRPAFIRAITPTKN